MTLQDWKELIGALGFPIAVTIFVLVRLDNTMKSLTVVITKLCERLSK